MASLSFNRGRPVIGYTDPAGKRHWLRPGRCDKRTAERVRDHVGNLEASARTNDPLPEVTAAWVRGLYGRVKLSLVRGGLVRGELPPEPKPKSERHALGDVFAAYIKRRTDLKPRSLMSLTQAKREAVKFFGADRDIRTLSKAEGNDYLRHLKSEKSGSTSAAYFKRLRQVLADAADRRSIDGNPLAGIKAGREKNADRRQYVPAADIEAVIAQCPDARWKLLFALTRFGGLRMPSETHGLRWANVAWDRGRMIIHSPKTERHEGKGMRTVPIFPELLPYLRDAFEAAKPGEEYCLQGLTRFPHVTAWRMLRRAGLARWPKLFQNLRASRQTDLAARFPLHVVCSWLGNTEGVAADHYLIVTEADYERGAASAPEGADRQPFVSQTVPEPAESGPAPALSNAITQNPLGESGSPDLASMTPEQQQQTHLALQYALRRQGRAYLKRLNEALPYIRRQDIDRLEREVRAAKANAGAGGGR